MTEDNTPTNEGEKTPENVMEQLYNEAEQAAKEHEVGTTKDENQTADSVNGDAVTEEDTAAEDAPAQASTAEEARLFALQAEAEKNLAGWQRTLADFQNFKRRVERERAESRQRISMDILKSILPVIDDFERALGSVPEQFAGDPWLNGVTLIQSKLNKLLDDHDVRALDPVGEPFDPNLHEAIGTEDSDEIESGHVTVTLQKGYISGTMVLRPALVRVAS